MRPGADTQRLVMRSVGYTLVEIMIVVTILGVLLAITVPGFIKSRSNAQAKVCIANLTRIEAAKQQWAFDTKVDGDAIPVKRDLLPYLRNMEMPVCPAGGSYAIRRLSVKPTCSEAASGHNLP